jgi:hypothetical protein
MKDFQLSAGEDGMQDLPKVLTLCSDRESRHQYRWFEISENYRWTGTYVDDFDGHFAPESPIVRSVVGFMEEGHDLRTAIQRVAEHILSDYLTFRSYEGKVENEKKGPKLWNLIRGTSLGEDHPPYVACGKPMDVGEVPETYANSKTMREYVHMLIGLCRAAGIKYGDVFRAAEKAALRIAF